MLPGRDAVLHPSAKYWLKRVVTSGQNEKYYLAGRYAAARTGLTQQMTPVQAPGIAQRTELAGQVSR
ncbi:hypothetical protein BIY29_18725 [Brenneria alni]|uniref:Uncharacterized protein n=1 Tax=Brenneria alni TaxID=71656 RepID=A0A421DJ07_9GAMM|nr:hypothetical protein [Brenneria alni]RLM18040.1 hypothetical protein BIY29_18725 [Brenneria alni]